MPTYSTFVEKFFVELDALLSTYVYDGYHALSSALQAPLAIIATLYIVILGLAVMNGWIKVNMGTFVKSVIKIGLIYTVVTNWDWVSENIVGMIYGAVDLVSGALMSANPLHIPGFNSVNAALQQALIEFMMVSKLFYNSAGWSNIAAFVQGFGVQVMGYIMVGVALFEITLAKVMLAVLFTLMPVFVCFCFFESTKSFFDRFVGAIASQAFILVMVNAVLILGLELTFWAFPVLQGQSALNIGFLGVVPIVLVSFIVVATLMKVTAVASQLGGSIASASGSAMFGAMVGGAVGSSMGGLRGLGHGARAAGAAGGFFKNGVSASYDSLRQGMSGARSMINNVSSSLRGSDL